jgi:hypothetical protein
MAGTIGGDTAPTGSRKSAENLDSAAAVAARQNPEARRILWHLYGAAGALFDAGATTRPSRMSRPSKDGLLRRVQAVGVSGERRMAAA